MNYAVVDLPMLSNAEQCADACMRLKAEYLYQTKYNKIKFQDVNGQSLGASREPFTAISADSWCCQHLLTLPRDAASSIGRYLPGDVFVYPENARFLGHAVFVVAVNKNGKKPFSSPKAIHWLVAFTSSAT